ncbi:hypothetical protein ILYODFUR_024715 [Ilyodon furcidens]|uniref:Uncharacterized protein n=1 Tax=Ilyodon furcidens TaxID=33524 RepID=A0ABV0SPR8_9TELE
MREVSGIRRPEISLCRSKTRLVTVHHYFSTFLPRRPPWKKTDCFAELPTDTWISANPPFFFLSHSPPQKEDINNDHCAESKEDEEYEPPVCQLHRASRPMKRKVASVPSKKEQFIQANKES